MSSKLVKEKLSYIHGKKKSVYTFLIASKTKSSIIPDFHPAALKSDLIFCCNHNFFLNSTKNSLNLFVCKSNCKLALNPINSFLGVDFSNRFRSVFEIF